MMLNMTGLKQDYTIGKLYQLLAACSCYLYQIKMNIVTFRNRLFNTLIRIQKLRFEKEKKKLAGQQYSNPLKHHTVI